MRDMDIKCFEEGWSEGVGCGENLFPEGKESSLGRVCLLVSISCEMPADRGLSAGEGWRPPPPRAYSLLVVSALEFYQVPRASFYLQLESGVHCQGRHGVEPSVSGKWQPQISRPFTLWGSENRGVQALLSLRPSPEVSVEMVG